MDVNKRIRTLTEQKGWSRYRLAKESGLAHTSIANIWNRGSIPSIPTIEILCRALGITLAEFFSDGVEYGSMNQAQKRQADTLMRYYSELDDQQKHELTEYARNMCVPGENGYPEKIS